MFDSFFSAHVKIRKVKIFRFYQYIQPFKHNNNRIILKQKGLSSFLFFFTAYFCVGLLQSQVVFPSSCISRSFDNTDFNLPAGSSGIYQGNGVFRLTTNANFQGGAVWYKRRLDMRVSFRIAVDLNFGSNDIGADGIAFVLQNLDTGQGSAGGGLGYGGATPITPLWPSSLTHILTLGLTLQQERIILLLSKTEILRLCI
jgi:hypothetical protein